MSYILDTFKLNESLNDKFVVSYSQYFYDIVKGLQLGIDMYRFSRDTSSYCV